MSSVIFYVTFFCWTFVNSTFAKGIKGKGRDHKNHVQLFRIFDSQNVFVILVHFHVYILSVTSICTKHFMFRGQLNPPQNFRRPLIILVRAIFNLNFTFPCFIERIFNFFLIVISFSSSTTCITCN